MKFFPTITAVAGACVLLPCRSAGSDFETFVLNLRELAIRKAVAPRNLPEGFNRYPWKKEIVATVFWVGERPTENNPTPNHMSSWDAKWSSNFGGYDTPEPSQRQNFIPKDFVPRQNPFYVALPYNDITHGGTKPESRKAIPWFEQVFRKSGQTVCKGRWVAVRHGDRIAYAQWEDCGPFRTNHWAYVFGNERPRPNLNQAAGLDISPAVRDYLRMDSKGIIDWKFVEAGLVPDGPWARYGNNNTLVLRRAGANLLDADPNNAR